MAGGEGKQIDWAEEVRRLEQEIAEVKGSWPKHSVPAAMVLRLEELEEALEEARKHL